MIIRKIVFILTLLMGYSNVNSQTYRLIETNEDIEYYNRVLERKAILQMDSIHTLDFKVKRAKRIMLKEMVHKKTWIKIAVGEAAIIAGGILIVTSGAWIPVIMGVSAVELFLILEGRYRLNIHDMKPKQPVRYKM
jgi:hypothetical protein